MAVLTDIEPKNVLHFFEELSKIPRGSYNEKAVSDFCVSFAKERNLEVYQDKLFNVVIRKNASKGYEDVEPVVIQGHLDMVCEKTSDSDHDFTKEGLELYVEEDFLKARNTTLGGDDGIAVAFALAILDDDTIEHPVIEAIFTVSEEVGMDGAAFIDLSMIKGRRMLNIDSEQEGVFTVGCAGGNSSEVTLPVEYKAASDSEKESKSMIKVTVSGLIGGHSGVEIDKNRANANIVIGRYLMTLNRENVTFDLIDIKGGGKENAIPFYSEATIQVCDVDKAKKTASDLSKALYAEFRNTDPDIKLSLEELSNVKNIKVVTEKTKNSIILLICGIPNGIQKMSSDIEGLVETSLNLGIMKLEGDVYKQFYSVRSSIKGSKDSLTDAIRTVAEAAGAKLFVRGNYPAWEYKPDSKLRDDMIRIYEEMYGKKPVVEAIHAGLECGILSQKLPGLDCVSFGPDLIDIHTAKERMSLSSVKRVWEYILEILKCK